MTISNDTRVSSGLAEELLPARTRSVASPSTRQFDVLHQMQRFDAGLLPGTVRASDGAEDGIIIKEFDKQLEEIN